MEAYYEGTFNEEAENILGPNITTKIYWNNQRQQVKRGKINTKSGVSLNNTKLQGLHKISEKFNLPEIEIKRSGAGLMIEFSN